MINALAEPLRLSAVERVTVPAVVPQLVKPLSTPPFCAKLFAGTELLTEETAALERELVAGAELGVELGATLERLEEVTATLEREEELTAAPHNVPFTTGRSTVPPLVLPWNPKETD